MGKRLERFGEVRIIDETNGFELDSVEKTESRFVPISGPLDLSSTIKLRGNISAFLLTNDLTITEK